MSAAPTALSSAGQLARNLTGRPDVVDPVDADAGVERTRLDEAGWPAAGRRSRAEREATRTLPCGQTGLEGHRDPCEQGRTRPLEEAQRGGTAGIPAEPAFRGGVGDDAVRGGPAGAEELGEDRALGGDEARLVGR